MKNSGLYNCGDRIPDERFFPTRQYLSLEFAGNLKEFFEWKFQSSVNITVGYLNPGNVLVNESKIAVFFKKALELEKGTDLIRIHVDETIGFRIQIRISFGERSDFDEDVISGLAKDAGFDFKVEENSFVLTQKMEIAESIALSAIRRKTGIFDALRLVYGIPRDNKL